MVALGLAIRELANGLSDPGMLRPQARILASHAAISDVDGLTCEGAQHDRMPHEGAATGVHGAIDLEHLSRRLLEAGSTQWMHGRWLAKSQVHIHRRAALRHLRGLSSLDLSVWTRSVRGWH